MKTLAFFGASRKNGQTKKMLELLLSGIEGEKEIIDCYREKNISPCLDCRYCWKVRGCAVKDDMQPIYKKIDEADIIVLAAPMYFHSVPGPMKSVLDRCQVYWAGMLRGDHGILPRKKGAILMVGGAPSFPCQFDGGAIVLQGLLGDLEAEHIGTITLPNSDRDSLETRPDIAEEIKALASKLNGAEG